MDYKALARTYNTLQYSNEIRDALCSLFKGEKFDGYSKSQLHEFVNNALIKNYEGEEVLKFKLANYFQKKNYIAAFEVNVNSSRADFLVINGETKCFEIKSKIDNLNRLQKQVENYKKVFEYNIIVLDKTHIDSAIAIIPEYYGVWTFNGSRRKIIRDASISPELCSKSQLEMLTKKELFRFFENSDKDNILKFYSPKTINQFFKESLKKRYELRWNFIRNNWDDILPIDIQFFFNSNIDPKAIYEN